MMMSLSLPGSSGQSSSSSRRDESIWNSGSSSSSLEQQQEELPDSGIKTTEIVLAINIFLILLGVGMAVDKQLFKHIVTTRQALFAAIQGVCQQYIMMPLISYLLALAFGVDEFTALGFIMCGVVPGGSTSNAITTLCKGVLELSVFMTVVSTILGFGFTPLWLFAYGRAVGVNTTEMDFRSLAIGFALLAIPLSLGALLSFCFPKIKKHIELIFSTLTVVFVIVAIIIVCIENVESLQEASWRVHVPACFYFLISSSIGYFLSANVFKNAPAINRTIFIEVGLQNTTLVYSLVEVTLRFKSQRTKAIAFPLLYTIWMFAWSAVAVFVFRWHKGYNTRTGIPDTDPHLDVMVHGLRRVKEEGGEELESKEEQTRGEMDGGSGVHLSTLLLSKEDRFAI